MGDVRAETGTVKGRPLPGRAPSEDGLGSRPASFGLDPGLGGAEQGPSLAFGPQTLLWLQGAAGNAAVGRLVQSLRPGERDAAVGPAPAAHTTPNAAVAGGGAVVQRIVDKPEPHPKLRWGSSGPEVGELQERLNEQGVADPLLEVDEDFGAKTYSAVVEFQGRHGLQVDGVAGIRTWGVLDALQANGIAGPTRTILDDTTPLDITKELKVQDELGLVPGKGSGGAGGITDTPDMIGTGPGGDYETKTFAALDDSYQGKMDSLLATPATDMDHAKRIGEVSQKEVESFFGKEITMASRKPTGSWHPGSSMNNLEDASQRNSQEWEIIDHADYMMDNSNEPAHHVEPEHNYNPYKKEDLKEHDRVRNLWLAQDDGRRKVNDLLRAWPLATNRVRTEVGLRYPGFEGRAGMWDLFAGLMHECLHLVTHPNYRMTEMAIGGGGSDVLGEGMTDHWTMELWQAVRPSIAADAGLRATVEGPYLSPIPDPNEYAAGGDIDSRVTGHAYESTPQADAIVKTVTEPNARAAYFMGHVEALGLGPQTPSQDPLTGLASWSPDAHQPDEYMVPEGGQKVGEIKRLTGSDNVSDRLGEPMDDPDEDVGGGERLWVPGLRWHTTIPEDTRGQVANQHGIAQADLERANKMGHQDPGTPLPPGKTLMIPVPR